MEAGERSVWSGWTKYIRILILERSGWKQGSDPCGHVGLSSTGELRILKLERSGWRPGSDPCGRGGLSISGS